MQSDKELIKRAKTGDFNSFELLVRRYDHQVLKIAYSFRNSEEDAKDIYQEVFLRVFKGLKNFQFKSEFSTWLFRITTNVCISFQTKNEKTKHSSLDREIKNDEESTTFAELLEGSNRTDSEILNSELASAIEKSLNNLPPQQKLAFTLKHYEGYKIKEISKMMNCAEGTIKRYLFTAANKMKEDLKEMRDN